MPRIVLFGATGYTGRLVADALAGRGVRPLLVARNPDRLGVMAADMGLEHAVADVDRPDSLRALLQRGDVLVSTVGPVRALGRAGGAGGDRLGRLLPGLHRGGAVHPLGLRALWAGSAGGRLRIGDRLRLRLGAGQPGGRAGAAGGRGRRGQHGHRLLHHRRRRDGRHERRHARLRGRAAAGAQLRVAGRPPGHRAERGAAAALRGAARHLGRQLRGLRTAAAAPAPARGGRLPGLVRRSLARDAGAVGRARRRGAGARGPSRAGPPGRIRW